MKLKKTISILFIYLLTGTSILAQDNSGSSNINNFKEDLLLQTDRSLYINGEKIWFSAAYFINGAYPEVQLSKVMYLEILNDKNKPVVQEKFEIKNRKVNGHIKIPDEIYTGNYVLRAYTKYLRNFGPAHFTYLPVTIINPDYQPAKITADKNTPVKIIPEGGNYMDDIETSTAIVLNDSLANLAESVSVVNNNGQVISDLELNINGLYSFNYVASTSSLHQLKITLENNDTLLQNFPAVNQYGLTTNTKLEDSKIIYSLFANSETDENNERYNLQVYSSDYRKIDEKYIRSINGKNELIWSKTSLKQGLLYFVLRDSNGHIKKINTLYVLPSEYNQVEIQTGQKIYSKRENIELKTHIPQNGNKKTIHTTISVTRTGTYLNQDDLLPRHIFLNPPLIESYVLNNMPLNDKQLKQIKSALIHFDESIKDRNHHSHFNEAIAKKMSLVPEYKGITLGGVLQDKITGEPLRVRNIYLSKLFGNSNLNITGTDENGKFLFTLKNIEGITDLYLCPDHNFQNNKVNLRINNAFSNRFTELQKAPVSVSPSYTSLIEEMMISHQLSKTRKNRSEPIVDTISQLPINTVDMETVYMDDYITLKETQSLIDELVPNVYVNRRKDKYNFRIMSENPGNELPGKPLVLLDNVPIFDANKIMEIHPSQFSKVTTIIKPYMLGEHSLNGVVMIQTNTNNFADVDFPPASSFLQYKGYSKGSHFTIPNYSEPETLSSPTPDFRTTLFWNPDFTIPPEGASTSFHASDRKGEYEIRIRGYSEDGEFYYGNKSIMIE